LHKVAKAKVHMGGAKFEASIYPTHSRISNIKFGAETYSKIPPRGILYGSPGFFKEASLRSQSMLPRNPKSHRPRPRR